MSSICRAKPPPPYERVADAIPVISTVVQEVTDTEVLKDALWALSYHSDTEEKIERIDATNIIPPLIKCLEYAEKNV